MCFTNVLKLYNFGPIFFVYFLENNRSSYSKYDDFGSSFK